MRLATIAPRSIAALITTPLATTTHAMVCARSALSLTDGMGNRMEHEPRAPPRGPEPEHLEPKWRLCYAHVVCICAKSLHLWACIVWCPRAVVHRHDVLGIW